MVKMNDSVLLVRTANAGISRTAEAIAEWPGSNTPRTKTNPSERYRQLLEIVAAGNV